jgi:hypothetical protein
MEPNSIAVDEKEYEQWLAQNNLKDPLPKASQDDQVPTYTPSEVDPNLLNPPGRDLPTALVSAAPYIAGAGVTGLGLKYLRDIAKGRVAGPVAPAATSTGASTGTSTMLEKGGQALTDFVKQQGRFAPTATTPAAVTGAPGQTALSASRVPVGATMGAVSALAAPYMMAAYEQDKIRANPSAPGLESNPYAQMVRGEAATQGQAGAMNRRQAIAGQQYGGLTQEQQRMLEQDRIDQQIRIEAFKRIRPIAPGR